MKLFSTFNLFIPKMLKIIIIKVKINTLLLFLIETKERYSVITEFFCSLMNCDIGNFEKISSYCYEIKRLNFKIFAPDINKSNVYFEVIYNKSNIPIGISYGLSAIKNIGENSVLDLLSERKHNGEFKSLIDLQPIKVISRFISDLIFSKTISIAF